jgi:predicted dehydrogenase
MRRNGALAADYARRHGVPRWYDDAHSLIADPEVDAVYVATPPATHCHFALAVAAAGKPAYVEKPMARHTPECDRMIAAFAAAEQKLFVAYYRRRLPRFLKVAELIGVGALGTITAASYRLAEPHHRREADWRTEAEAAGGGHFLDLGSHALDLLEFLLGPLGMVTGVAANHASSCPVEDTVALSFLTEAGVPGTMICDFASGVRDDTMRITGTEGEAVFSVFGAEPLRLVRGGDGAGEVFDLPHPPHVAQPMIQSVVDDLLGRAACPSTGESARRTSRIMDQVLAGYYGGRDDAFWQRPESWSGRRQ